MTPPVTTYIALGSNQGNRLDYLQKAVDAIFSEIGSVTAISNLYETPSWGFDGNDFLNACLSVDTYYPAEKVLQKLLDIETRYGRKRQADGYANRTLDLDVLFYGQQHLKTARLTLPHPHIAKRRFVLQPLADIAADLIHPDANKSIKSLLNTTSDNGKIDLHTAHLNCPKFSFDTLNFLAIEGNIGAGKTSLAHMISHEFKAKLITERFKDNPFLPKFYENRARYAFPLEMSFLADRYQQFAEDIGQFDLFNDFVVSDYDIYKSMIFAQVTLQEEENQLYKRLFNIMYKDLAKPDLYVYLYQNTERLLQNIKKRGREYEQNIPANYLKDINQGYLNFIRTQAHLKTKIIDISELDFIANREDYRTLLEAITAEL